MSDVPELDRLIEEHEVFRHNIRWEANERFQMLLCRIGLLAAFALIGIALAGPAVLLCIPLVWRGLWALIPDPPRRDPFRRYMRK